MGIPKWLMPKNRKKISIKRINLILFNNRPQAMIHFCQCREQRLLKRFRAKNNNKNKKHKLQPNQL